eukprot:gnl/TRDRNA2_/TRDRNA2_164232_c1_seq1.p1 gnl/TRDRNA2_/TRDRNA2_164232_c1~~gnl/TRDRNA2_/TRDRNA2_164232_c1_seq1.p1  ORF type:complete len:231 (+),score=26.84 gnl/TRDRNA2_/TRDRNA2_164232_c1_seq1:97-789(+)
MSLLPPHIRGLPAAEDHYWFLADRIRARNLPHCNRIFKVTLQSLMAALKSAPNPRGLFIVDVGAHLGDCCLWAAAQWGPQWVRCHAFERNKLTAEHIARSVDMNGLSRAIAVHTQTIGNWLPAASSGRNCSVQVDPMPLDCFLQDCQQVDIVSIYVGGMEEAILEGTLQSLKSAKIGYLLVRSKVMTTREIRAFIAKYDLPYVVGSVREGRDTLIVIDDARLPELGLMSS